MAVTYLKGSSGDTLQWQGNLTVDGTQVFTGGTSYAGDVTLGDASSDNAILKGRLVTGTAAGSSVNIDATTSTYPEGVELRYNMADWVDVATFTEANGMYLRMETSEANATGTLQGATIYGVANNVGVQNLKGLLSYAYIKGATAKTVATAYGAHAELSWDAGAAATTITTEMAPLMAKITGGAANDYTKIHGVIVRAGDMDGASRTYGNGILIEDDASLAGSITWTKAISVTQAATTGVDLSGAIVTGLNVAGSAMTTGISVGLTGKTYTTGMFASVTGSTITTGISFVGTSTTGISMTGAITTGLEMTGAMTTGINVAPSAATTGISVGVTGKTYATGISVGVTGSTLTAAIGFNGTITAALDFTGLTAANGQAFSTSGTVPTVFAGRIKVLDAAGVAAWIPVYSTSNEA